MGRNDDTALPEYLHKGLPQGCRDKQKKTNLGGGEEEEVRAVRLRCLRVFWRKYQSGLFQQAPASFLEQGQLFIQLLLTLGRAAQHHSGEEDAQGHDETMLGGASPDTAVPRRGSPLFWCLFPWLVAGSAFGLYVPDAERLRAIPCWSGGIYRHLVLARGHGNIAHPVGQLLAS